MNYPAFFDQAPTITVRDSLAEFLGACDDGLITYRYIDAVRLSVPSNARRWQPGRCRERWGAARRGRLLH